MVSKHGGYKDIKLVIISKIHQFFKNLKWSHPFWASLRNFTFLCLVCLVFYQDTLAQQHKYDSQISIDTRYFINTYSNIAVANFGLEIVDLTSWPANLLIKPDPSLSGSENVFLFYDKYELQNLGNGLLTFITTNIFSTSFLFSYHEYGHGTRVAAIGYKPYYGHGSINSEADRQAALSGSVKLYDNFLSFYMSSIFNMGGYTIADTNEELFPPLLQELDSNWQINLAAGGLNNEMLFTDYIESRLQKGVGHIGYLTPFLSGKLSVNSYATGAGVFNDLTNIATFYEQYGHPITVEMLQKGSRVSFFGSALTYQFLYQFMSMFAGNSPRFSAWKVHGFQLPNTSFYMTTHGLSYKITTGYEFKNWRIPVAYEFVFEGKKKKELTVGFEKNLDKLTASTSIIFTQKPGVSIKVDYEVHQRFFLTGGFSQYNRMNLAGERLIPSLEHGNVYNDFYLGTSIRF